MPGITTRKNYFLGKNRAVPIWRILGTVRWITTPRDGIFEILGTIQIVRSIPTPRNSKKIFAGIVLRITTGQKNRKFCKNPGKFSKNQIVLWITTPGENSWNCVEANNLPGKSRILRNCALNNNPNRNFCGNCAVNNNREGTLNSDFLQNVPRITTPVVAKIKLYIL